MTARRRDVKKSEFVAVTDSQSTDSFDFVRNGQNLRMTQEDLILALGVSGPLQSIGDPAGIPVLSVSGGVNYIRNIIGGPGVMTSIGPQNGVKIQQNYNVDKGGIPIMINEGSDQPTFRSISGTGGIAVSASGDEVSISAGTPVSQKTVQIYEIGDFPTPVGDAITLEDDTQYLVQNDISSSYYYVFGENTVLTGADGTLVELEYTGTGSMINAVDKNMKIRDIILRCDSGDLYDISSTTGLHFFRHITGNCYCDTMGTLDNVGAVIIDNVSYNCTTTGITYNGNFVVCIHNLSSINISSGTGNGVDLGTATFTTLQFNQAFGQINTTGYVLVGLPNSGNINPGGLGTIINSKQLGTANSFSGVTPYDDLWEMQNNADVPNSFDSCLVTHGGGTITITTIATPVIIGATWTEQDAHRFTTTAAGTFTYTGKGSHVAVDASITADIVTGIDNVSFFLYLNGVQITASRVTREFNAGDPGNVTLVWETPVETNDYLQLYVQNDDATADVIITTLTLRIRS